MRLFPILSAAAIGCITTALTPLAVSAEEETPDYQVTVMESVNVIGNRENITNIPGSAHYLGEEELDTFMHTDPLRIMRQIPGVNITEEDGYGGRPNIGMRGGRSERSANITLMEDGVLIAPAPYAAPAAYYFPHMQRMKGVEVRKGSSTVKFGPRTTSGVLNLLSSPIPSEAGGEAFIGYGMDNTQRAYINYGQSWDNVGFVFDLTHDATDGFKELDFGGDTGYSVQDGMAKLRFNTNPAEDIYQEVTFKVGAYEEDSDETYLGLTESDFNANPYRRYASTGLDNLDTYQRQYQMRHFIDPGDGWGITTTLYYNEFARDWYKLQNVSDGNTTSSLSNALSSPSHLAILRADVASGADALTYRANNREFYGAGIQSNVRKDFTLGNTRHALEFGIRYHEDEEDRYQHEDGYSIDTSGNLVRTSSGTPGTQANRISSAEAIAFFFQDEITYDRWTFLPGVRYESITLRREDYGSADPGRTGANLQTYENDIDVIVPGMGVAYELTNDITLLAGVHKGFAPPAPPSGSTQPAQEEESIAYEAGLRYHRGALRGELIGFFNDYENLLGAETLSSGSGTGTGDQFNGGEVDVIGLEASLEYDLTELLQTRLRFPVSLAYTFTRAEFQSSFSSSFSEWGNVQAGDELPYIPEHQIYTDISVADEKWRATLAARWVNEMRTTAGSGNIPVGEGTDEYIVVDLSGEYQVHENAAIFGLIDNVFDEEYIVSRRPIGPRPGRPLTALAGVKLTF